MNERFRITPRRDDAPLRAEDKRQVGIMRRIAAARLRHRGLEMMIADVTLIISELLTNALLHSGTSEIGLTLSIRDNFLRIAVRDGVPGNAEPRPPDDNAESGRGLVLVRTLAKENGGSWGTSHDGATTWCLVSITGEGR
jgi:anti-sigma regulatory factor (Ser/Thr protein kinase)